MSEREQHNARVIEEFRMNGGMVNMLLLHHRGARSGIERVTPIAYQQVGDAYAVFGGNAGGLHHPHWFLNLKKNPKTSIELGTETVEVLAHEVFGVEREVIWTKQKELWPVVVEYEEQLKGVREIPALLLERRS